MWENPAKKRAVIYRQKNSYRQKGEREIVMSYAVLRIRKITSMGNVHATEKHLKRTRETPNADPEKLHLNKNYVSGNLVENVENLLPEKRRKNAVLAVEHLMTASPEFFQDMTKDRIELWAQTSVQWAKDAYGEKNIASAELHLDESTPHLHLVIVPLVKDKAGVEKLNARELFGGHKKMMAMQDSYARRFESFGLERGVKGSKATHTEIKQFYGSVEQAVKGVKMPTKTGVLDFGYTERLEKHINEITPLTRENRVILRERTNLRKNLDGFIDESVAKRTIVLTKELNQTKDELKTARGIATQFGEIYAELKKAKEETIPTLEKNITELGKNMRSIVSYLYDHEQENKKNSVTLEEYFEIMVTKIVAHEERKAEIHRQQETKVGMDMS